MPAARSPSRRFTRVHADGVAAGERRDHLVDPHGACSVPAPSAPRWRRHMHQSAPGRVGSSDDRGGSSGAPEGASRPAGGTGLSIAMAFRPPPCSAPASRCGGLRSSTVVFSGHGVRARHRDGPVGLARLRHRPGQRSRAPDLPVDPRATTTATRRSRRRTLPGHSHSGYVIVAMTEVERRRHHRHLPVGQRERRRAPSSAPPCGSSSWARVLSSLPRRRLRRRQGGWTPVASGRPTNPTAIESGATGTSSVVNLCTLTVRSTVHGTLGAVPNSNDQARTVNTVADRAVRGRRGAGGVPVELGDARRRGATGHALGLPAERGAVGGRPFLRRVDHRWGYGGYADTCDQTCQSYPGMADENATSLAAANDTAGLVMTVNGTGTVANTEYSASSGGYSAGGPVPRRARRRRRRLRARGVQPQPQLDRLGPGVGRRGGLSPDRHAEHHRGHGAQRPGRLRRAGAADDPGVGLRRVGLGHRQRLRARRSTCRRTGSPSAASRAAAWAATGSTPPTAACSASATPCSTAAPGACGSTSRSWAWPATHDAGGYWEVASDGGVFSFGDATFHGSTGAASASTSRSWRMAVTPDGGGYWLVASDGGIFAFGDAGFFGSTGNLRLNQPVIGMVPTHDGGGYWLVASDGGIFAFGDAGFFGSLGGVASGYAHRRCGAHSRRRWLLDARGLWRGSWVRRRPGGGPGGGLAGPLDHARPHDGSHPGLQRAGFVAVDASGQAFAFGDAPVLRRCEHRGERLHRPGRGCRGDPGSEAGGGPPTPRPGGDTVGAGPAVRAARRPRRGRPRLSRRRSPRLLP